MSRLRSTLSDLPVDREIAGKVTAAQRLLTDALRLCDHRKEQDPLKRRRMMATRRDLERALGALSSVRRVGAPGAGLDEEDQPSARKPPTAQPSVPVPDTTEDG